VDGAAACSGCDDAPAGALTVLRIFTDRGCVPPGVDHTVMLYPFWGNPAAPVPDPVSGDYARYMNSAADFLELAPLEAADVAVLPFAWECVHQHPEAQATAARFVRAALEAGKPAAVFFFSDSDAPVPLEATVFRTSLAQRSRRPREFALPAWNEDIVSEFCHGRLPVRPRPPNPTIGFCGRVPRRGRLREFLGKFRRRPSFAVNKLRSDVLDALRRSTAVQSRFIERPFFYGDSAANAESSSQLQHRQWRREFVDNLIGSDYALCVRGIGNFSFRLYEALCCGRIPVIVDTDCVLPFDWEVRWQDYGVWVRPDALDSIGDRVAEFNAGLSDRAFVELQHECRRLWEDRLSPEGFFRNFYRHFQCAESPA
jgi:hypothetical protein